MKLTHIATAQDAGRKIKYYVRGEWHVAYHQYCMMKASELLRVNGSPVHSDYILREGDVITAELEEHGSEKNVIPENGPVTVAYEDDDIMIIDKPAPLACQCTPKQPSGTLENRLTGLFGTKFVFRPLNRLDKGTDGLMCTAKHAHAYQLLQKQLHTSDFLREYQAVTEGTMTGSGTIDLPIGKLPEATVRRGIDLENGKQAVTHYSVEATSNGRSLVRLRLETGRTHQIRVHLSASGHPICGDFLYGTELESLPGRFALHSCRIRLIQPLTGKVIDITSPLPEELKELMRS